jgi:alkylated DNA repair protein alkB family protein 6
VCWSQPLPAFLAALVARLVAAGVYPATRAPNHVLVNAYCGGAGIPPHADGDLYWPRVVTISLAGPALICFTRAGRTSDLVAEVRPQ